MKRRNINTIKAFSLQERHEIYKKALFIAQMAIDWESTNGLCCYLDQAVCLIYKNRIPGDLSAKEHLLFYTRYIYPEMQKYKPLNEDFESYWFCLRNQKLRKAILLCCIEQTKP